MTGMIEAAPDTAIMNARAVQTRRRIDWKKGAELLVAGHTPEAVATALEISEARFWTHLHHSLRFATHIQRAMDRKRLVMQIQYPSLQMATLQHALQDAPDGTALQWLQAQAVSDAEKKPVDQLRATAGRYPNQAFRKRITAEKAQMDAQVAESRVALAQHLAARAAQAAADKAAADKTGPDKTELVSDKGEITSDKDSIRPNKESITTDKVAIAPDKPSSIRVEGPVLPPRYQGPPRRIQRTIVDLTDMDGNPLPDVEQPG